jgi:hypothetical protein
MSRSYTISMKTKLLCATALAYVAVCGHTAWAQEIDPKLKGLPPAVQKAIAAETKGATIKNVRIEGQPRAGSGAAVAR